MRLAPRFIPCVKGLWLALRHNNLPRDLRRKITNYVAKNIFEWETQALRDERIRFQWDAVQNQNFVHNRHIAVALSKGMIVEPWETHFNLLGVLKLTSVYIARRHRPKNWPRQRYHFVWLSPQ